MKSVLGVILIIAGIALGMYVGVWLCFIGGIISIINEIKSPEAINNTVIAWGLVKIIFAGTAGWISAILFIIPGVALIQK